ncbi:CHAP domain-containing protein [Streptomyces bambusae]|uniref:CHAP domain-containing protein n=1 Tax=Streptomyces bambusae TaxID=1550616 RepID=UPI001D0016FD|nr:CHAP domain-containing protein [Streptomyces bambusae]MCB5169085.1 CHAP domain-containing protein [Streptomyces bambusae]
MKSTLFRRAAATVLGMSLAAGLSVLAAAPAQAATGSDIARIALQEAEASHGCSYYGSCPGGGWCAVFATWVWRQAGVTDLGGLSISARDFYNYGQQRGTLDHVPDVGDAVVYNYSAAGNWADHVNIVVKVEGDMVTTVGGNESNSVQETTWNWRRGYNTGGQYASAYIAPAGLTASPPSSKLAGVGDVFGNGRESFVQVKGDQAILFYGNGTGSYASSISLGYGWSNTAAITGVGNFGGKGGRGLLQLRKDGSLWLYDIVNNGGYADLAGPGVRVDAGFAGTTAIAGVGDVFGNGRESFVQVKGDQAILFYGNGTGSYASSISLGYGWSNTAAITGVGNFDGKGARGMLQLRKDGSLWLYDIVNNGGYADLAGPGVRVDAGFAGTTGIAGVGNFDGVPGTDFLFVKSADNSLNLASGNGTGSYRSLSRVTTGWE